MTQLFVDLDGVLADFDAHHERVFGFRPNRLVYDVDWEQVRAAGNFYFNLPPMPDMALLWDYVARHRPIVLTGVPYSVPEAADNKREWVRRHLGADVEVRCCRARDKSLHAGPGDILVDDWDKYRQLWIDKGGVWIAHTDAASTIVRLAEIGR